MPEDVQEYLHEKATFSCYVASISRTVSVGELFNWTAVDIGSWMSYCIPLKTTVVINYPCPYLTQTMLLKRGLGLTTVYMCTINWSDILIQYRHIYDTTSMFCEIHRH